MIGYRSTDLENEHFKAISIFHLKQRRKWARKRKKKENKRKSF